MKNLNLTYNNNNKNPCEPGTKSDINTQLSAVDGVSMDHGFSVCPLTNSRLG